MIAAVMRRLTTDKPCAIMICNKLQLLLHLLPSKSYRTPTEYFQKMNIFKKNATKKKDAKNMCLKKAALKIISRQTVIINS